jgi:hypothetical protein
MLMLERCFTLPKTTDRSCTIIRFNTVWCITEKQEHQRSHHSLSSFHSVDPGNTRYICFVKNILQLLLI